MAASWPDSVMLDLVAAGLVAVSAFLLIPSAAERRVRSVADGRATTGPWWRRSTGVGRRLASRWTAGPAARRRRARVRTRAIQALGALATELEAGQSPRAAIRRCAGVPPTWPAAAGAAQFGGDVAEALVADARASPLVGDLLRDLAACWRVAERSGAGLAVAVARLAQAARTAEDVRVDLEAQLAAPRATARLLGLLPALGIGFGVMLGAEPLAWLTGTGVGRLCLATGVALTLTGLWWTGRIAAAVERQL
jgi:tight adherence protein B